MLARVLAKVLEAPLAVRSEPLMCLDAIVVLGAPLHPDGSLSSVLAERVAAAAALYHDGGATLVIASGGTTHGAPRAEADALAEALRAAGVPDVVVERASQTTAENARFVAELVPPGSHIWIVTQPFHAKRAAHLFRSAGLVPHVWHITDSVQYRDRGRAVKWLAREWASWAMLAATHRYRRRPRL